MGTQRPKSEAGEQPGGLLLRRGGGGVEWGRDECRRHVSALPTRWVAHAEGWQEGAEAWRLCRACVELAGWRAVVRGRPYLVSVIPGARQRAVARAWRPVCEVARQLVKDGRGIVLRARGRRRRHEELLRELGLGRGLPRPPGCPLAAAATSCPATRRQHLVPAARSCGRSAGPSCRRSLLGHGAFTCQRRNDIISFASGIYPAHSKRLSKCRGKRSYWLIPVLVCKS